MACLRRWKTTSQGKRGHLRDELLRRRRDTKPPLPRRSMLRQLSKQKSGNARSAQPLFDAGSRSKLQRSRKARDESAEFGIVDMRRTRIAHLTQSAGARLQRPSTVI